MIVFINIYWEEKETKLIDYYSSNLEYTSIIKTIVYSFFQKWSLTNYFNKITSIILLC